MKYNVVVKKGAGGDGGREATRPEPPGELAAIAYATLDDLEGRRGAAAEKGA